MSPRSALSHAPLNIPPAAGGPRPATDTLDPERARWLESRYGADCRADPRLAALREALLTHGGWGVVPLAGDPHIDRLGSGAACVWPGAGSRAMKGGGRNRCHGNAALAFLRRWPDLLIGTGYALSDDGVWRQHSWLFEHRQGAPTSVRETTVPRLVYAGVILDPLGAPTPDGSFLPGGIESMRFCLSNLSSLDGDEEPGSVVEETMERDIRFAAVIRTLAASAQASRTPGSR